jgi:hypothetical protein
MKVTIMPEQLINRKKFIGEPSPQHSTPRTESKYVITYRVKGVTYYGGTKAEIRKVKGWKFVDKVMTIGQERDAIKKYVDMGYIVKDKQIYRASMIYINKE